VSRVELSREEVECLLDALNEVEDMNRTLGNEPDELVESLIGKLGALVR
jgi:hypothetical protein